MKHYTEKKIIDNVVSHWECDSCDKKEELTFEWGGYNPFYLFRAGWIEMQQWQTYPSETQDIHFCSVGCFVNYIEKECDLSDIIDGIGAELWKKIINHKTNQ